MEIIRTGNLEYHDITQNRPDIYLGSGDMGASFDKFGTIDSSCDRGIMHGDFYGRNDQYNTSYHVHTFKTKWEGLDEKCVTDYCQSLDIYDGILTTRLCSDNWQFTGRTGFHTQNRNVLALEYIWNGQHLPTLTLTPLQNAHEKKVWLVEISDETIINDMQLCDDTLQIDFRSGLIDGRACLKVLGDAVVSHNNKDVFIHFKDGQGRAVILLSLCKDKVKALDQLLNMLSKDVFSEIAASWHERWGESRICFDGHDSLLKLYYRSIFHMLCSHSANDRYIAPPMGWAGRNWRYHFPQDFEYMAPAMLRLGYTDILKAKVEMYAGYIENLRANTRRIYNCDGVMWTWEFPVDDGKDHLPDGTAPYVFMYEVHNSVYPAKLAWETAAHI
ncbi:MAG: hypothetical protein IKC46_12530, partial [Lachnospiraceae bacterium]|nr:hypothetical protein [Lachnospiraceae bacterium]